MANVSSTVTRCGGSTTRRSGGSNSTGHDSNIVSNLNTGAPAKRPTTDRPEQPTADTNLMRHSRLLRAACAPAVL